jgi:hypothetical protein
VKARPPAFEVLDALGLARLEKRAGDLDGAVPLRVAQACVPLLEGNAFGFQLNLLRAVALRRGLGRLDAAVVDPHREAVDAAHRSAMARLVAQGYLAPGGAWHKALAGGPVQALGRARLRLWTGLLLRPEPGVWLRVSGTANRRNRLIEIDEHLILDEGAWVPLLLDVTLRRDAPDRVRLEGELATVAPMAPGATLERVSLADAPALGVAHAAFYDAAYFAAKKGEPTRKYRKTKARDDVPEGDGEGRCRVIDAGPAAHAVTRAARLAGRDGPRDGVGPARVVFENVVPFEARFDGHTLAVEPDRGVLAEGARVVERAFAAALGPTFVAENQGALWYLTKYFTPHPPGEPHFFVKPWSFVETPRGWSSLVEGVHGDGFDVMRGVIATDVFHATPAVFHVHRAGDPIRVKLGEPLIHVIPVPRRLLDAGFREARFLDA